MVAKLVQKNKELKEKVRILEEKVNRNSSNSSMPPSSNPPETKPRNPKPKSPRKRGAQPGHDDQQRKLYPSDEVDCIIQCKPVCCDHCGKLLYGDDPNPRREQKVDLPPATKPEIVDYLLHSLLCTCGHVTPGKLPDGVQPGVFGPQIQAIVSLLSGAYRLSKREIVRLMSDAFNTDMSLGTVSNLENATSNALAAPVEEAKQYVKDQEIVNADETGWRENKKKAWLWTAITSTVLVFLIRLNRKTASAKELLGNDFRGIVHVDRWGAYNWVPLKQRQICWAHLKRDFQKVAERGGASKKIGNALLDWTAKMFALWDRVRNGTLARSSFNTYMVEIRQGILSVLKKGSRCRTSKTANFCNNLLKIIPALWTFTRVEGVEPTNNAAERAIRKPVLWRKGSFGTDSPRGSRFVERILTTVASLRAQNRNVLDYLVEANRQAITGKPVPSLLP